MNDGHVASGPLGGVRVLEMAGLGPISFAGMLLADMGADVVRIARPAHSDKERGATLRGRRQVEIDLKSSEGQKQVLALADHADVFIEGFRPRVMERLGLGPSELLDRRPSLVYGRMTGWGQDGPRASAAGHDINYIALSGALHAIGEKDPAVPLNLIGDYGGGALYLVVGVLAALHQVRAGGAGQVVDAAICDGTVSLMSLIYGLRHAGRWEDSRVSNSIDGGAPYYRTYRCRDGRYLAVGAIEPQFFGLLVKELGLVGPLFAEQNNRDLWPAQAQAMAAAFAQRDRDEWNRSFQNLDACVAPVNSLDESAADPHLAARGAFVEVAGERQPAPTPRFSSTQLMPRMSVVEPDVEQVLKSWIAQQS